MEMVSLCSSVGVVAHARVRKVCVPLSKRPGAHRHLRKRSPKWWSLSICFHSPRLLLSLVFERGGGRHLIYQMLFFAENLAPTGCFHYIQHLYISQVEFLQKFFSISYC